ALACGMPARDQQTNAAQSTFKPLALASNSPSRMIDARQSTTVPNTSHTKALIDRGSNAVIASLLKQFNAQSLARRLLRSEDDTRLFAGCLLRHRRHRR